MVSISLQPKHLAEEFWFGAYEHGQVDQDFLSEGNGTVVSTTGLDYGVQQIC